MSGKAFGISFAATFGSREEAQGFLAYLARGVGAEAYKRRGLTVSFRVDVAYWDIPAVKQIAHAVETWGGQLTPDPDTIEAAPHAPAMPTTTLDAVEILFLNSPWFPIRMGDQLVLTRDDVIVATVRVVGNATIVGQARRGRRAANDAERVVRFLHERLSPTHPGPFRSTGQLPPDPDTIEAAPQASASGLFTAPQRGIWCKDHMPKPEDWFPGDTWRELSRAEVQRITEETGEPVLCEDWELHEVSVAARPLGSGSAQKRKAP